MVDVTCSACHQKKKIDAGGFFGAVPSLGNDAKFLFICDDCLQAVAADCVGPVLRAAVVKVGR